MNVQQETQKIGWRLTLDNISKVQEFARFLSVSDAAAARIIIESFSLPAWLLERSKQAAETEKQAA